jgi:shikimate kinase
MNIVLIGYRGTGKSAVGQILAERLGRTLVNMDAEIVKQAGSSIPELVKAAGWEHFRDLETSEARKLAGLDNLVIDCGGGVIEREENIAILQQNARVFWLKADVATIVKRIEGDTQRPSLTSGKTFTEEVAEVLDRRTPKYRSAAHCEIDTDSATPAQIADTIIAQLD